MTSRKSRNRAKRLQTLIASLVLFAMIMGGGAAFALTGSNSPAQPTPATSQSL
jgi:hypothetical protein